jgi:hypothetical protein
MANLNDKAMQLERCKHVIAQIEASRIPTLGAIFLAPALNPVEGAENMALAWVTDGTLAYYFELELSAPLAKPCQIKIPKSAMLSGAVNIDITGDRWTISKRDGSLLTGYTQGPGPKAPRLLKGRDWSQMAMKQVAIALPVAALLNKMAKDKETPIWDAKGELGIVRFSDASLALFRAMETKGAETFNLSHITDNFLRYQF